jgi:hypothetical protein
MKGTLGNWRAGFLEEEWFGHASDPLYSEVVPSFEKATKKLQESY